MIIKISDNPERYVNTDNIEVITFGRARAAMNGPMIPRCSLDFYSGRSLNISENAGRVLVEFAESNTAFEETPELGTQLTATSSPLKSRLAQYLRDSAPSGAGLMDLIMQFNNSNEQDLLSAINELQQERVIILVSGTNADTVDRYYHASNAPRAAIEAGGF